MLHKKLVALICAISMALPVLNSVAYATELSDEAMAVAGEKTDVSVCDGICQLKTGEYVYASVTEDGDIQYEQMNRYDIASLDELDSQVAEDLPIEVVKTIESHLEMNQSEQAQVTIFAPAYSLSDSVAKASGKWQYGTYNGVSMKDYIVTTTNGSTGFKSIKTGTSTKDVASTLINVAITVTGSSDKFVSLVSSGVSVLTAFINLFSDVQTISGSGSDYLQVNLDYNLISKVTYAQIGSVWKYALTTCQVKINKEQTCQYYKNSGHGSTTITNTATLTRSSTNYNSPYPVAYKNATNGTYSVESASYKINKTTFYFSS